ncbi:MAG: alcohol dehydrogenase catalytic domain-containing protein [Pseudomonadota bacterium]
MKALLYEGARQMRYQEVLAPVSDLDADEVKIKVEAACICGSDMHAWAGHDERRPAPLILGHEVAGIVLDGALAGKRVTVNPLVTCGTCSDCKAGRTNLCQARQILSMPPRQGAFGEYLVVAQRNLVEIPADFPVWKAAMCEPIACGVHAVRVGLEALRSSLDQSRALILGGGAIGLGMALVLRAKGCKQITIFEPNPIRGAYIEAQEGFCIAATPDDLYAQDGGWHLIMDAHGSTASRTMASQMVRPGGVIILTGLADSGGGLDTRRMTLQEITVIGTYTYSAEDFLETAEAMFQGAFGDLDWPERRSLAQGAQAFHDIEQGLVRAPKVILEPA